MVFDFLFTARIILMYKVFSPVLYIIEQEKCEIDSLKPFLIDFYFVKRLY